MPEGEKMEGSRKVVKESKWRWENAFEMDQLSADEEHRLPLALELALRDFHTVDENQQRQTD